MARRLKNTKSSTEENVVSVPENFNKPVDRIDQLLISATDELESEISKVEAKGLLNEGLRDTLQSLKDLRSQYRIALATE